MSVVGVALSGHPLILQRNAGVNTGVLPCTLVFTFHHKLVLTPEVQP